MNKNKASHDFTVRLTKVDTVLDPAVAHMHLLQELTERFDERHEFSKGQIVMWKVGLRNRQTPEYGEPVIVREVRSVPTFDPSENSAGSPYFEEPLTLVIALYQDGDLVEYRVDARRFEPWKEGAAG